MTERADGQLDVFEILALVEKEGLVPDKHEHPPEELPEPDPSVDRSVFFSDDEPDDGLYVARGPAYSYWVLDADDNQMHEHPFWSQVECWAFIVGWRRSSRLRA